MSQPRQNLRLEAVLFLVRTMRKSSFLRSLIWRMRCNFNAVKRHILVRRPIIEGGALIEDYILNRRPLAAGKMGSTESRALQIGLKRAKARQKGRTAPAYSTYVFHTLHINSGVFPQREDVYDSFCQVYLEAVKACDILVGWDVAGQPEIVSAYCPDATLISLTSIEPHLSKNPWSRALKGKRVLVISPFVDSITKQYAKREALWDNPDTLPPFELLTLRAPLSAGLVPPKAVDWFESLDQLKAGMDVLDYDVALIGAGAFSLPLAAHAKKRGKIGIHLGGGLQILFGVVGKRWKDAWNDNEKLSYIKPSWCSPSSEETPSNFQQNEGGCYW